MAGTTIEVTLKQDIYDRLEQRVRNGEAANLSELIQRDIEFTLEMVELDDDDLPTPLATPDPQRPAISFTEHDWEDQVIPARLAAWDAGDKRTFTIEEVGAQLIALRDKLEANKAA